MTLLAKAFREIAHPSDFRRLEPEAEGPGWISFAAYLADEAALDAWFDRTNERNQGRKDLTGSLMGLRLAGPAIDVAVSLYLVRGWAVPLPADGLLLRMTETGATTGVALSDPTVMAVAGDAMAIGPETRHVPDHAVVRRFLAEQLVTLFAPAFRMIRARTPYGPRGLWGAAADQIAGVASRRARALGLDQERAWSASTAVIDALAEVEPMIRIRPRPFVAPWPGHGGQATVAVKGACCLFFKTSSNQDDRRFCSNCPLLSDEARAPRMEQILAREYERLQSPVG